MELNLDLPQCQSTPSPWGDPALRAEQEMKVRRRSARLFNQIRLPLQARAGNRPTN